MKFRASLEGTGVIKQDARENELIMLCRRSAGGVSDRPGMLWSHKDVSCGC